MSDKIKLLHLANFAFREDDKTRSLIFDRLIEKMQKEQHRLEDLNAVIVAGDIGCDGKQGYRTADRFLEKLKIKVLEPQFDQKNFIICPGNRDLRRKWARKVFESPGKVAHFASKFLEPKRLKDLNEYDLFDSYEQFCRNWSSLSIPAYDNSLELESYTHGVRILKDAGLCFLVLNSSWVSLGEWEKNGKTILGPYLMTATWLGRTIRKISINT